MSFFQFTLDVFNMFSVHPPQESRARTNPRTSRKSWFAALLDCVPGILLLWLLLFAFIYLASSIFCTQLAVVYTIRAIGTKVPVPGLYYTTSGRYLVYIITPPPCPPTTRCQNNKKCVKYVPPEEIFRSTVELMEPALYHRLRCTPEYVL